MVDNEKELAERKKSMEISAFSVLKNIFFKTGENSNRFVAFIH